MAEKDLNEKLTELISSLQNQGILDDYFDELKGLQDEQSPQFVTNTIATYLDGAETTIAELTETLSERAVDYPRVRYLADKLKGSSMSIGGSQMADACAELCNASEAWMEDVRAELCDEDEVKQREACKALFEEVESEYSILEDSLNKIAKLEKAIYDEAQE